MSICTLWSHSNARTRRKHIVNSDPRSVPVVGVHRSYPGGNLAVGHGTRFKSFMQSAIDPNVEIMQSFMKMLIKVKISVNKVTY